MTLFIEYPMDLTGIQLSGNKMTFYNKQMNTSSVIWKSKEQTEFSTKQGGVLRNCIFCLTGKINYSWTCLCQSGRDPE